MRKYAVLVYAERKYSMNMRNGSIFFICLVLLQPFLYAMGDTEAQTSEPFEWRMMLYNPDRTAITDFSSSVTMPNGNSWGLSIFTLEDCYCYVILANSKSRTAKIEYEELLASGKPIPISLNRIGSGTEKDSLRIIMTRDRQVSLEKLINIYRAEPSGSNFNNLDDAINKIQKKTGEKCSPGPLITDGSGIITNARGPTDAPAPADEYRPFTGQSGYVWNISIAYK